MAVVVRNYETFAEIRTRQQSYWTAVLASRVAGNTPAHHAAVAPVATDDGTKGYRVGQFWYNTATDKLYYCESNSAGAAIWTILN